MKMNIKRQLSKAKVGNLKKFLFGSILVTFFVEQVPLFQFQLTKVDPHIPRDLHMAFWSHLMPRITGGQHISYQPAFFSSLWWQNIIMEEWPYSGTDFHGDLGIPLPNGEDFNDEGKKIKFLILRSFNFFWYICAYNISLVNENIGLERPARMSPIARHVPCPIIFVAPY